MFSNWNLPARDVLFNLSFVVVILSFHIFCFGIKISSRKVGLPVLQILFLASNVFARSIEACVSNDLITIAPR